MSINYLIKVENKDGGLMKIVSKDDLSKKFSETLQSVKGGEVSVYEMIPILDGPHGFSPLGKSLLRENRWKVWGFIDGKVKYATFLSRSDLNKWIADNAPEDIIISFNDKLVS